LLEEVRKKEFGASSSAGGGLRRRRKSPRKPNCINPSLARKVDTIMKRFHISQRKIPNPKVTISNYRNCLLIFMKKKPF
jgi:hypothetical protein